MQKEGGYGLINRAGKLLTTQAFAALGDNFYDDIMSAQFGKKWGFIDKTGKLIIAAEYDEVVHFTSGLAMVRKGGRTGYIDKSGKLAIPLAYLEATPFNEKGFAAVSIGSKPVAAPPAQKGKPAPPTGPGERKWGIIDRQNNKIVPTIYDQISPDITKGGLIMVVKDGSYGYIDAAGKEVIPPKYDEARDFTDDGLAAVSVNDKWGFINTTGSVVIKPQFDEVADFSYGLAPVDKNSKWGFVDKSGKMVIPAQFDQANQFINMNKSAGGSSSGGTPSKDEDDDN